MPRNEKVMPDLLLSDYIEINNDILEKNSECIEPKKLTIMDSLEYIWIKAKKSGLSKDYYKSIKRETNYLNKKINLNPEESVVLSSLISFQNSFINPSRFSQEFCIYTGITSFKIGKIRKIIENMFYNTDYIIYNNSSSFGYSLNKYIIDSFDCDKNFTYDGFIKRDFKPICDLFMYFGSEFDSDCNHINDESVDIFIDFVLRHLHKILEKNPENEGVKFLNSLNLNNYELFITISLLNYWLRNNQIFNLDYLSRTDNICMLDCIEKIIEKIGDISLIFELSVDKFQSSGINSAPSFRYRKDIAEKFIKGKKLQKTDIMSAICKIYNYNKINKKDMFYSDNNEKRITELSDLLINDNFKNICKRLENINKPKGFTCIFHGVPGVGKTETVKQIALKTKRDIISVNVTDVMDKFVGESEYRLNNIFSRYSEVVSQCIESDKNIPILLFNEADSLFSKRMDVKDSVDQMYNSLQNILLEQMERFEGILIITTNMLKNFDSAFERRFLYKIKFEQPTYESRIKLWKSMIPSISDKDIIEVANKFDFSGGQIENISRKIEINKILHGSEYNFHDKLIDYCNEEKFENIDNKKIGFIC